MLVFLGFNLGNYQETIRREIDRLNLQSRVYLLDALPREQLLDATASADVGIQLLAGLNLNHRLTLPNKLFEYMMAGLPFISTDSPEVGTRGTPNGRRYRHRRHHAGGDCGGESAKC